MARTAINVTISDAPSTGGSFVARVWKPTVSPSRINVTDLLAQLNGGNVVINTKGAGAEAGTITIANDIPLDDLTTTFPRTLTLEAQDDVLVNAAIFQSGAGGDNVPNSVDLVLNANLGSGNGNVSLAAEIFTGGGALAISGVAVSIAAAIDTNGGDLTLSSASDFISGPPQLATDGGVFTLNSGTFSIGSPVTTGGGAFTVTAVGSSTIGNDITTSGGDLSITLSGADAILTQTAGSDMNASGGAGNASLELVATNGAVNTNASVVSGAAGVEIVAAKSSTLKGTITANGNGSVLARLTETGALLTIEGAISAFGAGSVSLRSINGGVFVKLGSSVASGPNGSVLVEALGLFDDVTCAGAITSGTGGIELFSDKDVIVSAAVSTTGPITIESDGDGGGLGAVNATASIRSTGAGNVFIKGNNVTLAVVSSAGGSITIDNDGSALVLNGTVSTGGGGMLIESSSAITFASGLNLKGGVTGAVAISSVGTSLVIPSTLNIDARGITFTADGAASDITLQRALTAGAGGFTFTATDQIILSSTLNTSGPISLLADSDGSGVGDLAINAAITGADQPVNMRGSGIAVNAVVASTFGEIGLQPNAGTIATIAANLTGPTRVLGGTARFTTGTISANALAVNSGATLDFDAPARSLTPASFNPAGETHLRLGGTGAGQFNRILCTGVFTAGGVLTVTLEPGFTPSLGQSFHLFDFAGFAGAFTGFNLPPLPANIVWDTSQLFVNGTLRTLTPIELWRQQNFNTTANGGLTADTFDSEGDGTANVLEYALGMNPNSPSVIGLPVFGKINIAGIDYLTLTFTRPLSATDISYRVQAGTPVTSLSDGSFYSISGNVPTNAITTEISRTSVAGFETVIVRDNTAMSAASSRFMRLKVTRP